MVLCVDNHPQVSHQAIAQAFQLAHALGLEHRHRHHAHSKSIESDTTSPTRATQPAPFVLHVVTVDTESQRTSSSSSHFAPLAVQSSLPLDATMSTQSLGQKIHEYIEKFHFDANYDVTVLSAQKGKSIGQVLVDGIMEKWPKVNMCVVGTRNQQGLKKLVLGSTSEYLIQALPCPVMVCKNPE